MAEKKIIAVVGATGQQGSGLVKAILADPSGGFAARAITRNPNSDKAKELARLGAEVVAGDVDDEASLTKAFAGRVRRLLRDVLLGRTSRPRRRRPRRPRWRGPRRPRA